MDMQTSFLDRLFESGLLIDTGVDGLYGRSGQFEDVIAAFERPENASRGAIQLDGQMVERLHADMAKRTIAIADAIAATGS